MPSTLPTLQRLFLAALLFLIPEASHAANLIQTARHSARASAHFSTEWQRLRSSSNRRSFPHLGSGFEVLAPSTSRYNCISHTLGIHNHWINPRTGPANAPLAFMDRLYRSAGYRRLSRLDIRREPGEPKVVVFGLRDASGRIARVTHAAIQSADGGWQSKLGKLALIRHRKLRALVGPEYGVPIAVYAR